MLCYTLHNIGNTNKILQLTFPSEILIDQPAHNENHQSSDLCAKQPVPHKVYLCGVDNLTTGDIKSFAKEHLPPDFPTRIEWIDDSSANIIFETSASAIMALNMLSFRSFDNDESISSLQLRTAKKYSAHPETELQIRMAVLTDQKRPRAHEASRFYMMHPEHDPREKRRRMGRNESRRNRYGDEEHQRRKQNDEDQGFSANMYDDDADALAARAQGRRSSTSTLSSEGRRSDRRKDSYRPNRTDRRRLRDRSASPVRESEKQDGSRSQKRRTPPPPYCSRDPHPFPKKNEGKELFPSISRSSKPGSDQPSAVFGVKELFPNKTAAAAFKKELFPLKSGTSVHRRSDAFDAADETADLFATGMTVPFVDGSSDRKSTTTRTLADRISDSSRNTRTRQIPTKPSPETDSSHQGFSIRGASTQQDAGFSIRGLATDENNGVKELFPGKGLGNAGKELFSEKLQGRGGKRNKAIDMFY